LAQQAYQAWATLEAEAQERLVLKTGGLDLSPLDSSILISDYANSLQACAVPFELLDAAEIMKRWPAFQLANDIRGLYQSESGLVDAARSNAAHQRLAREHGATLREGVTINAIRPLDGEIEIIAGDAVYRCRKLIIAAGAWSNQALAYFGCKLPLTITQEQVTYFATPDLPNFAPERFPIWIWMDEPCFYGFPVYGEAGVKVAQDVGGQEVTAETRTFEPNPDNLTRVQTFMERYLPTALGPIIYTKTCLYTMPPDRDFVIDAIPGHDNVYVAIGAGHAFKFASLIGKILSELALDGQTGSDIQPFKIDRPILTMKNPPKSFMV
jgi:sarcosine oxidase